MIKLRTFRPDDAPLLQVYLNFQDVTTFLSTRIPQPYTETDAVWWVHEGSKVGIARAIQYNDQFVGTVGADRGQFEKSRSAEVGYWIGRPFWGKGIATEALRQLTALIFSTTTIARLQAYVFEGNIASMKVLEKNGYTLEGILNKAVFKHGQFYHEHLYARVNHEQSGIV